MDIGFSGFFPPFPLIPSLKQSETFKLRDEGAEAADPDMSDRNATLARARGSGTANTGSDEFTLLGSNPRSLHLPENAYLNNLKL